MMLLGEAVVDDVAMLDDLLLAFIGIACGRWNWMIRVCGVGFEISRCIRIWQN